MKSYQIVLLTSLVWLGVLSSCANLQITTWFLDGQDQNSSNVGLIRKDTDGNVIGHMTFAASDGYLCYSPQDDSAWRERLNLCCNAAGVK